MALLLDYIYTGNVTVHTSILQDFLALADLLKLKLARDYLVTHTPEGMQTCDPFNEDLNKHDTFARNQIIEAEQDRKQLNYSLAGYSNLSTSHPATDPECVSVKKNVKKLPELMPIAALKRRKETFNKVVPSPWCPRLAPVLADPKTDCVIGLPDQIVSMFFISVGKR